MKDDILNSFDKLSNAKKTNVLYTKLVLLFAFLIVIAVLVWGYMVNREALNKVIVIDKSGEYLKTTAEDNEKLFVALIKTSCSQLVYYANSFDRLTVKENQAKAMFLCNKADLQQIFNLYTQEKCYYEVVERGVVYKCEFEKLINLTGENEPYNVEFTSILTIIDGTIKTKFRIVSKGNIIKTTPQFPENTTGYFFSSYMQSINKIEQENGDQQTDQN